MFGMEIELLFFSPCLLIKIPSSSCLIELKTLMRRFWFKRSEEAVSCVADSRETQTGTGREGMETSGFAVTPVRWSGMLVTRE